MSVHHEDRIWSLTNLLRSVKCKRLSPAPTVMMFERRQKHVKRFVQLFLIILQLIIHRANTCDRYRDDAANASIMLHIMVFNALEPSLCCQDE